MTLTSSAANFNTAVKGVASGTLNLQQTNIIQPLWLDTQHKMGTAAPQVLQLSYKITEKSRQVHCNNILHEIDYLFCRQRNHAPNVNNLFLTYLATTMPPSKLFQSQISTMACHRQDVSSPESYYIIEPTVQTVTSHTLSTLITNTTRKVQPLTRCRCH